MSNEYGYGVYGKSVAGHGYGVFGLATATTPAATGVHGETWGAGAGVSGYVAASTGTGSGVHGATDHKSLSPMDVVAVLTKVVQEQQRTIASLQKDVQTLKARHGSRHPHGAVARPPKREQ